MSSRQTSQRSRVAHAKGRERGANARAREREEPERLRVETDRLTVNACEGQPSRLCGTAAAGTILGYLRTHLYSRSTSRGRGDGLSLLAQLLSYPPRHLRFEHVGGLLCAGPSTLLVGPTAGWLSAGGVDPLGLLCARGLQPGCQGSHDPN